MVSTAASRMSDVNIATALKILVRQNRWHQETDATADLNATRIGRLEEDMAAVKRHVGLP